MEHDCKELSWIGDGEVTYKSYYESNEEKLILKIDIDWNLDEKKCWGKSGRIPYFTIDSKVRMTTSINIKFCPFCGYNVEKRASN